MMLNMDGGGMGGGTGGGMGGNMGGSGMGGEMSSKTASYLELWTLIALASPPATAE
jgi:preprotein translocase subunit SecG